VVEVHRRGVELEEATVGQGGDQRRRHSVDKGAVVGVSVNTTRGEAEVGSE
jgi:hypothetical protein